MADSNPRVASLQSYAAAGVRSSPNPTGYPPFGADCVLEALSGLIRGRTSEAPPGMNRRRGSFPGRGS